MNRIFSYNSIKKKQNTKQSKLALEYHYLFRRYTEMNFKCVLLFETLNFHICQTIFHIIINMQKRVKINVYKNCNSHDIFQFKELTSESHGIRLNASMAESLISIGFDLSFMHNDNCFMAFVAYPAFPIPLRAISVFKK